MGFPTPLDSGQKATTRESGYWSRTFLAINPGEFVFQCQADTDIDDTPFIEFAWTNTVTGAYTDVYPGMVVYISSTDEPFKDYKYRGRVRKAPTAGIFYIDLNATTLETGDYITVIRDADLFARIRQGDLVDSEIAYHNLPPMITGLPSLLVLYDADNDGVVDYTAVQSGIAVSSTATSSFTWLWTISGAGSTSFTSGSSTSQNPTIQFQAGYHYLLRCRVTDSNSVQHFVWVQVYAITRTFTAPVILPAVAGNVRDDIADGYSGSITAYGGVADLPYRTHAAVFCVEHFGDDTSTPIITNILMHGRLRSESITTEGSEEGGALQQVTYPIEGLTSYMQRLRMPNDIVRNSASPSAWGEMVNPTPFRMAVYALSAYSTLLNLVSFSAGDSLFDDWRRGGEPVSVDGGFALDVLTTQMAFVDAAPNYAPDGEIRCEINASYKVDRSGLVTIMDFLIQDARSFTLDIDTSRITAQVIGYGGSWDTTSNAFVPHTASAPTISYGDAPENRELTRVLLQYNSTAGEASTELKARTGNDWAYNNPKWLLNVVLRDAHRWIVATNYQRYTFTLAAFYNLREIVLTTALKFQCQSVDITINPDGTYDVNPQFVEETEFTDAQSIGGLLPLNLSDMNPVLPILSDDPAFPDSPEWAFPTDTPTLEEQGAISPYGAYVSFSPFTPDQAAEAAEKQGTINCKPLQVNFRNAGTVQTDWSTVNGAGYTINAKGSAQVGSGEQTLVYRPVDEIPDGMVINVGTFVAGEGIHGVLADYPDLNDGTVKAASRVDFTITLPAVYTINTIRMYTYIDAPNTGDGGQIDVFAPLAAGYINSGLQGSHTYTFNSVAQTSNTVRGVLDLGYATAGNFAPYTPNDVRVPKIEIDVQVGGAVFADAFYSFNPEAPETPAQLLPETQGLRINSQVVDPIPPYDPSHSYLFPYMGDGNPVVANFADTDHTDNGNSLLYLTICRNPS